MATDVENLATALTRVRQQLADLVAEPVRPDYGIEGQSVSWSQRYKTLIDMEKSLVEALVRAGGPFEVHVAGYS